MNKMMVMNVFQCVNNLFEISHDGLQRKPLPKWMTLLQRTPGGKIHNKIRNGNCATSVGIIHGYIIEAKYCHNMRMSQACHDTSLFKEFCQLFSSQTLIQYFDSNPSLEVIIPGLIDIGKTSLSNQLVDTVLIKLTAFIIRHIGIAPLDTRRVINWTRQPQAWLK